MANRLSQMLNGNKGIQIYDLPVFTELLGISCEELLSAGRCFAGVRESFDELFRRPFRRRKRVESLCRRTGRADPQP